MSILRRTTRDPTDNEQADKAEFIQDIGTLTTNSSFLLATPMRRFFFLPKFRKLVMTFWFTGYNT
jgi:hypothetical protein